jgi:processive 1,2-diacylglycerol beta-glucosyltransferase
VTRRVLIVHSRVGGGHLSAARALGAALKATGQAEVRLVDAYLDCGRLPVRRFPALYAWLARYHPRLWAAVYHSTNLPLEPARLLRPFLAAGFRRVLAQERPNAVVSVLPVINGILAELARLEVVLTDWHSVHRFWVARGVDHYTAPTESARLDCIRYGAPPEAVEVVGLPVRPEFAAPRSLASRATVLASLGLEPDRFTVLVMVGAEGSPRALRNLAYLVGPPLDTQVLVICGRNEALRRQVEALHVCALGFVDNVAELMRAADLLVTKAGGLTLAEAFCSGVPVVVHDLLPGQEAGNLAFAQQHHAALYAPSPPALASTVTRLLANPDERAALTEAGRNLARPDAAAQIAAAVLSRS